jgi:cytochrome b pre-mRNA-processing protein 3
LPAKIGGQDQEMASFASLLPRLGRRAEHERAGFRLYGVAVAAAREPYCYAVHGVPDTLDGRFDLIGLHVFLLVHRLRFLPDPGPALAQAAFDAMFSDMDTALREMGVGDLSVGRRVRAMWEAFHGRARAYEAGLQSADAAALPAALARNVWRGTAPPAGAADALARLTRTQHAHLATQDTATLLAGNANFLPSAEAAQ